MDIKFPPSHHTFHQSVEYSLTINSFLLLSSTIHFSYVVEPADLQNPLKVSHFASDIKDRCSQVIKLAVDGKIDRRDLSRAISIKNLFSALK